MWYVVNGAAEQPAESVNREFRMVYLSVIVTWEVLLSFRFDLLIGVLLMLSYLEYCFGSMY